jgi:hypothetical protein
MFISGRSGIGKTKYADNQILSIDEGEGFVKVPRTGEFSIPEGIDL